MWPVTCHFLFQYTHNQQQYSLTHCLKGPSWHSIDLKRGKKLSQPPIPSTHCCATVRASCGRGVDCFVLWSNPIWVQCLNNFVAHYRLTKQLRLRWKYFYLKVYSLCMCKYAASKLQLTIRLLSILFFLQVINVVIQLLYPLNKSNDWNTCTIQLKDCKTKYKQVFTCKICRVPWEIGVKSEGQKLWDDRIVQSLDWKVQRGTAAW